MIERDDLFQRIALAGGWVTPEDLAKYDEPDRRMRNALQASGHLAPGEIAEIDGLVDLAQDDPTPEGISQIISEYKLRQSGKSLDETMSEGEAERDEKPDVDSIAESFVGRDIGKFRIEEILGHGSMGVVCKARDAESDETVALKVLTTNLARKPKMLARFQREASAISRLEHAAIVRLKEYGEAGGAHFLAMEFIEGVPLSKLLVNKALSVKQASEIIQIMASALHSAHEQGVIHRDIKPSNILLNTHGDPKLTDFGLASIDASGTITAAGSVLGTPAYMSPEQARGEQIEAASDIYGLGATLYHLVTGRPPYIGADPHEIWTEVLKLAPFPPSMWNADLPDDLNTIILKAMERTIGNRYATALDMASDLGRFLEGQPIRATRRSSQRPWVVVVGLFLLIILLIFLGRLLFP